MKKVLRTEEVKRYNEAGIEKVIFQIVEQTCILDEFGLDGLPYFKSSKGYEIHSALSTHPTRYSARCIYARGAAGCDFTPMTMNVVDYDNLQEAIGEYNKAMSDLPDLPEYMQSETWKFVRKTDFGCHTANVRKLVGAILKDCYKKN